MAKIIQVPSKLSKCGFEAAALTLPKRVIMGVYGPESSGKTRLAMTAPGPIAYLLTDFGGEQTARQFQSQKQIWIKRVVMHKSQAVGGSEKDVQAYFKDVWADFRAAHLACLDSGAKTIVWDSASEVWQLLRLATFGKLSKVMPHQYDAANAEYLGLLNEVKHNSSANFILLHKVKDEYKNDARTGKSVPSWWSATPFNMDVTLGMSMEEETIKNDDDEEEIDIDFICRVDRPHRENVMSKGKATYNDDIQWMKIMSMDPINLIPGTNPGDWV